MNAATLITHLNDKGIRLWADHDKLRLNAPKGTLTQQLKDDIATHKTELLTLLGTAAETETDELANATASGLSLSSIGQLIGGDSHAFPVIDPQAMAAQLKVTFRPLPTTGKRPSLDVLQLRTELESTLQHQGVTIVPWEKATRPFYYPLPFIGQYLPKHKQLSMPVVRADISAVIDVARPINRHKSCLAEHLYKLSNRFRIGQSTGIPPSIAEITQRIAWAEDHAIQRLEDPTATQVILLAELDAQFVDPDLPYARKISLGVNTLISQFSEMVIGVSSTQISILNMNLSDSLFARDNLDRFVAKSLIPKIYVPIAPLPLSRFETGHYSPQQSNYAQNLVKLSQSLAQTKLFPSGFKLAEVVRRQSHRDIVSALVNGRSGVSYGFVAYAEPPQYVGPTEISADDWQSLLPVEGYAFEEVRQTAQGRRYLKTQVTGQTLYKQIPDIWLVCSRSGANKTDLDISKDILRLGMCGKLQLQVATGIDLSKSGLDKSGVDIKPSYDTYVMLAIALAAALYTPELVKEGAPIIHFHGYPNRNWFESQEDYAGTHNPAVPCGTYESGVFNFLSIHQLASSEQRPFTLVGLVEPDHGINLLAGDLDHFLSRLHIGIEDDQISLGGQNLSSLRDPLPDHCDRASLRPESAATQPGNSAFAEATAVAGGIRA